jgi:hypothetical protein
MKFVAVSNYVMFDGNVFSVITDLNDVLDLKHNWARIVFENHYDAYSENHLEWKKHK